MADWDSEDFVIPKSSGPTISDRWEGEDEETPVKDSWEDDDEVEKSDGDKEQVQVPVKKKKKLSTIIAEKEREKEKELERKRLEKEERLKALTPEEKLAQKLRLQKIQQEADLELVTDIMGLKEKKEDVDLSSLDKFILDSEEGLSNFRKALVKKIQDTEKLEKKAYYVTFLEELSRTLCQNIEADDVKKVTTILNSLYNEKVKAAKAAKGKKKGATKAKLNAGQGAIADTLDYSYSEYDDFI